MNNISTSVSENWSNNNINNNHNPSLVSFVGLQANNYKQFLDWETNSYAPNNGNNNQNTNPFNITNSTNIFDYTHLSSLPSPSFNTNLNFIPPPQFADYPSVDFLKKEVGVGGDGVEGFAVDDSSYYTGSSGRIGLNLGHRTYFSSRETALIDRLFRRPRGFYQANQVPRCQAEGCKIDLTNAKHYHRRHKVCEFHSKATKVVTGGIEQRFCQQCSRFHVLTEFDQAKRSCRKRLADHNRRRRKPQPGQSTTDSLPAAQTTETANPQVGPSASISRSEHKEVSLSSSATTSAASRSGKSSSSGTHFINGPDLSLGGEQHNPHPHQRPFVYNQQSTGDFFNRDNTATTAAPYHNLFFSSPNSNESESLFDSDGNYV